MVGIKKILGFLWRVWFYTLITTILVALSPLFMLSTLTESGYPYFFKLARIWGKGVLLGMGFYYKIESEQKLEKNKSYIIVSNHTSMTDIMLMLVAIDTPFVFVGKKELAKLPIFGFFYKRTCILVDRSSNTSRHAVYGSAQDRLKRGLSICIFPEGGVPDDESLILDNFKDGAFRLAIENQIPIVPMTFPDNKKRFPYTLHKGCPGLLRAKIHRHIETKGLTLENRKEIREQTYDVIYNQLVSYNHPHI